MPKITLCSLKSDPSLGRQESEKFADLY
ncbi:hypothetical protein OIU74_013716 [Salix koriyanagi]|uniref:Uncharacterized protein n=1 Tax=Salix koriyanagi TaxID=2511006 RepID=A0A9Q0T6U6_9ROSI|nr:hypothetical protein OIU74_013716 [Salix koriyanagi]